MINCSTFIILFTFYLHSTLYVREYTYKILQQMPAKQVIKIVAMISLKLICRLHLSWSRGNLHNVVDTLMSLQSERRAAPRVVLRRRRTERPVSSSLSILSSLTRTPTFVTNYCPHYHTLAQSIRHYNSGR